MKPSFARSLLPIALLIAPLAARAQDASGGQPATESIRRADAPPTPTGGHVTPIPDAVVEEWRQRDRELFEQDTLHGGVGLLHTQHATSAAPGQFRVGFVAEAFSAGFLCSSAFPCPNPNGHGTLTSDTMNHLGGTLTLGATITRWLEAYGATGAYGNSDHANHPSILQDLGDTQLGLKAFFAASRVLSFGAVTELDLVNSSGSVGLAGSGTGAKFRLLGTADLRGLPHSTSSRGVPLRISLNTTYVLDNSAAVISDYEAAIGQPATRIERFGLQINRVDHFDIGLGAETFLADSRIRPFLEYGLLLPINRQGYACHTNNPSADACLANDALVPSSLTFGSRFFPWKQGFSLLAAFDVGVTGVSSFIEELQPTPPWMVYLGAGWAVDTRERPPIEKTEVVVRTVGPRPLGNLRGLVHPKDVASGILDAIVVFDDHPDITSRATAGDGRFSVPVDPGSYKLVVHAKGYRDGTCGGEMGPNPVDVEVDCPLEPALVQVTANEITIQQQIQFQVDQAVILPESDGLMREIADTLIKNPRITRVEVQGHSDSSGSAEYNQTLSEQRAAAVREWLTTHGVAPDRLVARGFGKERPLIPNVTKGMKAMNRRVQFIILEQTADNGPER